MVTGAQARAPEWPWPPHRASGIHHHHLPNHPVCGRVTVIDMKRNIAYEEGEIVLDTDCDICIYYAPRGRPGGAYVRGKDLYLHEGDGVPDVYYIHSWSMVPDEKELIQPVSMVAAEEFLEIRGLMLTAYPEQRGSLLLRSYGYGIAEEF